MQKLDTGQIQWLPKDYYLSARSMGIVVLKENMMKMNVGTVDRTIRIVAGIALIAATLLGAIGSWGWLGIVPILTGTFRFCPAYLPFGMNTCEARKQ
jgi:Protein of unknown function (DUF2892)